MRLPELHQRVTDLVMDSDQVIKHTHIVDAFVQALAVYSNDRPRKRVQDVQSAGFYHLPVPTGWIAGKSQLLGIEYPVNSVPAMQLPIKGVSVYDSTMGPVLHLDFAPINGAVVRVTYSAMHVANDVDVTIVPGDEHSVCSLAASYLCGQLAGYYAQETNSSIGTSTVDHASKSDKYFRREKELRAVYTRDIGASDKSETRPAGTFANAKHDTNRWWQ
jgi:hypothetical protein